MWMRIIGMRRLGVLLFVVGLGACASGHWSEATEPSKINALTPEIQTLVHVDFETLKRTPKRSFAWYRDLVAAQPRSLG